MSIDGADSRIVSLENVAVEQAAINRLLTGLLEHQEQKIDELKNQTASIQRLWVRLAQRHGWLEEGDVAN